MSLAVLSDDILLFFIGIEVLGIISAILVGIEADTANESSHVFLFNQFASLLFLVAVCMIWANVGSFEFSDIKKFCGTANVTKLMIPATLLLISCLCKGAQLPFSYWLLDAVKANTFASILMHAATIVGVGIIFIAKCEFIFAKFYYLKYAMITVGIVTACWMAFCGLSHNNVKKIMGCLTSSSVGLMFAACGIGNTAVALLYFICHAFFKAMLFLSLGYVMTAASGERNILKMGGLSSIIPKINDILWLSFLATAGFPFFVGFFAKISFAGVVKFYGGGILAIINALVNMVSVAAIFRMILISMYGKPRMDDATLARASEINSYSIMSIWTLIIFAIFGSFISWSLYEWGNLHFVLTASACSRNFFDYFFEDIFELLQIVVAGMFVWILVKNSRTRFGITSAKVFYSLFRTNGGDFPGRRIIMKAINWIFGNISASHTKIFKYLQSCLVKSLRAIHTFLANRHRKLVFSHVGWIIIGIFINLLSAFFWGK
jgi:NADH-quinone oxidoreductase subunit L